MSLAEEITAKMVETLGVRGLRDTPNNRISYLCGYQDSARRMSNSAERTRLIIASNVLISEAKQNLK